MIKEQLIKDAVKLYKETLNQSSKWFEQDVKDYRAAISKEPEAEIKRRISSMNAFKFNEAFFNREINLMDKAGMFM